MTRIIAGAARGHTLRVPSSGTRPTADRVREAVFSRLDALTTVAGSRVLDLYAGSGAVGLEAASRGASRVDLVDNSDRAVAVARKNIESLAAVLAGRDLRVHRAGVTSFLGTSRDEWDMVFIDPPYEVTNESLVGVLELLVPRLAADAIVAVERSSRDPEPVWPTGLRALEPREYGETVIYWLEPVGSTE